MNARVLCAVALASILICTSAHFATADRTTDECKRMRGESAKFAYTVPVYTNCSKYAQCSTSGRSYIPRDCPTGLFFLYNRTIGGGACQHSYMVDCDADPCRTSGVTRHADDRHCNFYFVCTDRHSFLRRCRPSHRYDARLGRCVYDQNCSPPTTTRRTPGG